MYKVVLTPVGAGSMLTYWPKHGWNDDRAKRRVKADECKLAVHQIRRRPCMTLM